MHMDMFFAVKDQKRDYNNHSSHRLDAGEGLSKNSHRQQQGEEWSRRKEHLAASRTKSLSRGDVKLDAESIGYGADE